jgi:hypothetical protein
MQNNKKRKATEHDLVFRGGVPTDSDFLRFLLAFENARENETKENIDIMIENVKYPYYLLQLMDVKHTFITPELRHAIWTLIRRYNASGNLQGFYKYFFESLGNFDEIYAVVEIAKNRVYGKSLESLWALFLTNGRYDKLGDPNKYIEINEEITRKVVTKKLVESKSSNIPWIIGNLCSCIWKHEENANKTIFRTLVTNGCKEVKILLKEFIADLIKNFGYEVVLTGMLVLDQKWLWNTFRKAQVSIEYFRAFCCTSLFCYGKVSVFGLKETGEYNLFLGIVKLEYLPPVLWDIVYDYYDYPTVC